MGELDTKPKIDPVPPVETPTVEDKTSEVDDLLGGLEEGEEEKSATESPTEPAPEEPTLRSLMERLEKNEDKTRDLETENAFLRGKLASDTKAAKQVASSEEDEDDPDEVIDQKLRKNAVQALKEREARLLKKIEKRLQTQTSEQSEINSIVANDRSVAYNEFPDLRTNQEFVELADRYLSALVARNGNKYFRGDIPLAARSAYVDLVRAGRIKVAGQGNGGNVRELVKKVETSDPALSTSHSQSTTRDTAKEFLSQFDKKNQESILRTCKKFEMSVEEYAKNYNEAKGESSNYGRE